MLRQTSLGYFFWQGAMGLVCIVAALPVAAEEEQTPTLPTATAPTAAALIPATETEETVGSQQPILLPELASDAQEDLIEPEQDSSRSCIRRDEQGRFLGWMDYQHCVFSGRTTASAMWFDDLFGDWYDQQATMMVSAISEVFMEEGGDRRAQLRLRASAYLPNAKKRFRLVLTDNEDDVIVRGSGSRHSKQSAALRWLPKNFLGFQSDFDVGVRGANPPDFFVRWRLQQQWPLWHDAIFRFGQSFRYGSDSEGSSISQLTLEQVLGGTTVARLGSMYAYKQEDQPGTGMTYGHGLSLSHTLPNCCSVSYGVTVGGQSYPSWHQTSYEPWLVYRRKFLRDWLFWEVEPRITYAKVNNWEAKASVVFRLEALFGQNIPVSSKAKAVDERLPDVAQDVPQTHEADTEIQQDAKD